MKRISSFERESSLSYEMVVEEHRLRELLRCTDKAITSLKKRDLVTAYEWIKHLEGDVQGMLRHNDRLELPDKEEE